MYKLLLFDIDDTICNASEAYSIAKSKCFEYLKKKYPIIDENTFNAVYAEARDQIHKELKDTASSHERFLYFQRMFEILGLPLQPTIIYEISKLYWKTTIENLKIYPGVKKTLKLAKENNMRVGIVSDLVANVQLSKLKKLGIDKYVDFLVTSEEAGKEKPHSKPFLLALKKVRCSAKETVMVGDDVEKDIKGAKRLGITAVLMNRKRKGNADFVMSKFDELIKILKLKRKKINKRKKIVVFDLMGTIFLEPHVIKNSLLPFLKKRGFKVSYLSLKKKYEKYSLGEINKKKFWGKISISLESEFLDTLKIDKRIFALCKLLKMRGYSFGILSNLPAPWAKYLVKKYNLDKTFHPIVVSGKYHCRKPSEKLYEIFINNIDCHPSKCYFVDDKLENLKEARFLLMKTIYLQREKKKKEKVLFIPDFKINDIIELKNILK
jgi:putative hydrolase of the HAD superfamily